MSKERGLKCRPLILFAFCLLLYMPELKIFPMASQVFCIAAPLLYLIANFKLLRKFTSQHLKILLWALLIAVLGFLPPLIQETGDFSYIPVSTYFFRKAIIYLALLCVIIKKHGEKQALQYFMYYFALTHVVYVIGTILLVLIPGLQDIWFNIFVKGGSRASLFTSYGYTFRLGWNGFAGFRLTLYCTIAAAFALFLRYGTKQKAITALQFAVLFFGCLIGNAFYGRSGLFATAIISAVAILVWNRKHIKRILLIGLGICLFALSINALKNVPVFSDWYNWMSSPIKNLLLTGDMDNSSFDRLQEMSQVEIPESAMVFGDGYYTKNGHYYLSTDVGFIRNVAYWGLIGAVASYGLTLFSILGLRKLSYLLLVQFLIIFGIFEFKGAVYYEFIPILFCLGYAYEMQRIEEGK